MSVWKKATKVNQKTHRERHQPEDRKHLGLLEKHKDYVKRARDANKKKATIKALQKRALNRNPDEFYHHMINSKLENGVHHEIEKEDDEEHTFEQEQLMQTQDYKYVVSKRTQELKKIDRLQAQLHLTSINHTPKNTHLRFDKSVTASEPKLDNHNFADVNIEALVEATKQKKTMYKELAKRISRERELAIVQRKLEMKRHLQDKKSLLKPKQICKGSKSDAPVYKWQYERKR